MAVTIDYNTYIISVDKSDTQFVGTNPATGLEVRQLDVVIFGQLLADVQDNSPDVWAPTAYSYTQPADVGGVQLAPVLLILSPYTVTFEDGQYAINFVGGNTNLGDFVNVNQVSIRPNNSAGQTFSDVINSQSFENASVWVDSIEGLAGTGFPRGTPSDPVNNVNDALAIAMRENLNTFHIIGQFTAIGTMPINNYHINGVTPANGIVIGSNLVVESSSFERIAILGSVIGRGSYKDCSVGKTLGLTGVEGIFDNCAIAGDIALDATATEPIIFKDCISAIAGTAKPGLNCNGTAAGINFRRYAGGLALTNFNNPAGTMTLDLMGSEVSINSTNCTNGVLVARGVGKLVDENGDVIPTGTSTINGNLLISNRLINSDQSGGGSSVWTTIEKDNALAWSRKASDNAEEVNLKIQ
jgi:hypothetical protein